MTEKEKLLEIIEAFPLKMTIHDLAKREHLESTADFIALNKMLNELEEELLISRDEKDRYGTLADCGFFKGKLSVNRRGFGFLDLEDGNSIFIPKDATSSAMDQDEVLVRAKGALADSPEGEVVRILKRAAHPVVGTYRKLRQLTFVADDERIDSRIRVLNQKDYQLAEGCKVLCSIVSYGDPLVLKIEALLGHEDDPGVDIAAVLSAYGIVSDFPEEVMQQLKGIPDHVVAIQRSGRRDLSDQRIVTIDGDDSKDLDDAISIEETAFGWRLGVHIADVSYYVKENTPLDLEARARGTSTYVVDRVVPMLPHYLSNGICSLNEGVERLAISCIMEIDRDGKMGDYEIFPSIIKSTARMTYRHVNQILSGDLALLQRYEKIKDLFFTMADCAQAIRSQRHQAGAIDFERDEAKIKVDEKGRVKDVAVEERGIAERIIEDFMVTANVCVAQHLMHLEAPALYRIHEAPEAKKMRDFVKMTRILGYNFKGSLQEIHPLQLQQCLASFKDEESYPVVSLMMLRAMQKARYDSRCLGHFGLALREYTHFTSPIRRYPDLIVHRQLRKYCFSFTEVNAEKMKQEERLMETLGLETSALERRAIDAERQVEDMKKAEFMEGRLNQKFDGVISGVTKFGFYVELANTIEGLVHVQELSDDYYNYDAAGFSLIGERSGKVYRLGQKVKVRVLSASKQKSEINFALAEEKKKTGRPSIKGRGKRKNA